MGLHHLIERQSLLHWDLNLKVLKEILQIDENTPINVLIIYIKRLDFFPNAYFAYLLLTILVIIAYVERSFQIKISKILFKVKYVTWNWWKIKWINYNINKKEMLVWLEYKILSSNSISQKVRKLDFKLKKIFSN